MQASGQSRLYKSPCQHECMIAKCFQGGVDVKPQHTEVHTGFLQSSTSSGVGCHVRQALIAKVPSSSYMQFRQGRADESFDQTSHSLRVGQ